MSDNKTIVLETFDPSKTYINQKRFDCENKAINKFVAGSLKKQVKQSLSNCFVLVDTDNNDRFVGFYTISAFSINADMLSVLSKGSLPARIPVSRLVMLGVDKEYKGRGLGKLLLQNIILRTVAAADEIGIYGLYLDADENAYTFYEERGFIPLKSRENPAPTPMFIHIDTLRDAI